MRLLRGYAPILILIGREIALSWHRRALREMGGEHPDAPEVVLKIHALENAK